jgi:hypothetical protein
VPSECESRHEQHLQALRQHFKEAHPAGKAAHAHVFGREPQMIRAGIRLELRRQRVDQVQGRIECQRRARQANAHAIGGRFGGVG